MKKFLFLLLFTLLFLSLTTSLTYAHPGNTAADGCHYCRTNCDRWGEAWNERHCHGGAEAAPLYIVPTSTPVPPTITPTPTRKPKKISAKTSDFTKSNREEKSRKEI